MKVERRVGVHEDFIPERATRREKRVGGVHRGLQVRKERKKKGTTTGQRAAGSGRADGLAAPCPCRLYIVGVSADGGPVRPSQMQVRGWRKSRWCAALPLVDSLDGPWTCWRGLVSRRNLTASLEHYSRLGILHVVGTQGTPNGRLALASPPSPRVKGLQ